MEEPWLRWRLPDFKWHFHASFQRNFLKLPGYIINQMRVRSSLAKSRVMTFNVKMVQIYPILLLFPWRHRVFSWEGLKNSSNLLFLLPRRNFLERHQVWVTENVVTDFSRNAGWHLRSGIRTGKERMWTWERNLSGFLHKARRNSASSEENPCGHGQKKQLCGEGPEDPGGKRRGILNF